MLYCSYITNNLPVRVVRYLNVKIPNYLKIGRIVEKPSVH